MSRRVLYISEKVFACRSIMAIPFVPENLGLYPSPDVSGWFRILDYQTPRGVSNGASLYLFHAWKISTGRGEKDSFVLY